MRAINKFGDVLERARNNKISVMPVWPMIAAMLECANAGELNRRIAEGLLDAYFDQRIEAAREKQFAETPRMKKHG